MSFVIQMASEQFRVAAVEAAFFELRVRIFAGALPVVSDLKIEENLSTVCKYIIAHYGSSLDPKDGDVLLKSCKLRNKILHCEFCSAREGLNTINPKNRSGKVQILKVNEPEGLLDKIMKMSKGIDVGQVDVADTKVLRHRDIYGWLLDVVGSQEFVEAAQVFQSAISVIDRLVEEKSRREMQKVEEEFNQDAKPT